ncbi:MAG: type II toxin-antitoxin system VapC family toxin [bacterium]
MRKIFLDTCGILALVNKRDSLHQKAVKVNGLLLLEQVQFFTTEYILVEVGNALAKNKGLAIKTLKNLCEGEGIELIKITDEFLNKSLQLYEKYSDKDWGLTDVSSFVIMNEFKTTEAFTDDKHFEQFGFQILLK